MEMVLIGDTIICFNKVWYALYCYYNVKINNNLSSFAVQHFTYNGIDCYDDNTKYSNICLFLFFAYQRQLRMLESKSTVQLLHIVNINK